MDGYMPSPYHPGGPDVYYPMPMPQYPMPVPMPPINPQYAAYQFYSQLYGVPHTGFVDHKGQVHYPLGPQLVQQQLRQQQLEQENKIKTRDDEPTDDLKSDSASIDSNSSLGKRNSKFKLPKQDFVPQAKRNGKSPKEIEKTPKSANRKVQAKWVPKKKKPDDLPSRDIEENPDPDIEKLDEPSDRVSPKVFSEESYQAQKTISENLENKEINNVDGFVVNPDSSFEESVKSAT
eukprot:TRINITY_DN5483_c0_g1_i2.p1 TRINITY_DN5483_c0_g1~~TRINITY_DN5483_c0_g1_i2.p1  ORF type:complete len:234 (+),score=49.91 TRINITY_DN5483_c0_g1_i2:213-914(+)